MWALLLLPVVLLVLYFAQRLLFRRLWDENLTVQISFDRDYIFCGEEANLVETIVNNKYLPLPVLEVGFDMSRWVVFQDEENSTVSDMTYRRDVFTASVRQRITRTLPVRGKKRGYYRIASTTVTSYDFLMTEKQVAHFKAKIVLSSLIILLLGALIYIACGAVYNKFNFFSFEKRPH